MVSSKQQLRLAVETEEEQDWRMMHLPNGSLPMEMDEERKATLEKMVATTQPWLAMETEEKR